MVCELYLNSGLGLGLSKHPFGLRVYRFGFEGSGLRISVSGTQFRAMGLVDKTWFSDVVFSMSDPSSKYI